MCEWNDIVSVNLARPDYRGCQTANIDRCIAPIVQALNDAGIQTIASCCGHGTTLGSIVLEDRRELLITDFEKARVICEQFRTQ